MHLHGPSIFFLKNYIKKGTKKMKNMIYADLKKMSYGELLELRSTINHLIYLEEHPEYKKRIRKERYSSYWDDDSFMPYSDEDFTGVHEYNKNYIEKLQRTANDICDATGDLDYAIEVVSSMLHGSRLG